MVNTQSVYDIEYVFGEFGDSYNIGIKNDDGSNADISAFDGAQMTVSKMDDAVLFTQTTDDDLTITSPNVVWAMSEADTSASDYDGKIKVQIELTTSTTKKRMTKIFYGFIYKNQVP